MRANQAHHVSETTTTSSNSATDDEALTEEEKDPLDVFTVCWIASRHARGKLHLQKPGAATNEATPRCRTRPLTGAEIGYGVRAGARQAGDPVW